MLVQWYLCLLQAPSPGTQIARPWPALRTSPFSHTAGYPHLTRSAWSGQRAQMATMAAAFVKEGVLPTELAAWCLCALLTDSRTHAVWGEAVGLAPAFAALLTHFVNDRPYPLNLQMSGGILCGLSAVVFAHDTVAALVVDPKSDIAISVAGTVKHWLATVRTMLCTPASC